MGLPELFRVCLKDSLHLFFLTILCTKVILKCSAKIRKLFGQRTETQYFFFFFFFFFFEKRSEGKSLFLLKSNGLMFDLTSI